MTEPTEHDKERKGPVSGEVEWTHDGLVADLPIYDALYGHRSTVVGGGIGLVVSGLLAPLGFPDVMVETFMLALVSVGLMSMVGTILLASYRSRGRTEVAVSAVGIRVTARGAVETVAWDDVTGLRVRGPRPWVVRVERRAHDVDVHVGEEGNARWLAAVLAQRVRAFVLQSGDLEDVPESIRQLAERQP